MFLNFLLKNHFKNVLKKLFTFLFFYKLKYFLNQYF